MLELSCFEKLAIKVLKHGHIPEHIAFIMDGNRRYAKNQKKKALSGHQEGTKTLKKCLLYCLEMGVKFASFYAFSIQNFNRKQEQVQFLMQLARNQFSELSQIYEKQNILQIIMKNNIKVIFAGDLQGKLKQLYPDVKQNFKKIQEKTKDNTSMTVYICFAYDSIFEINQAIDKSRLSEEEQQLMTKSQKNQRIFNNLLIPKDIDLLIRTSNQYRLSNFMLMQARNAIIEIQKTFWPSFNMLTLAKILLKYNYYFNQIKIRSLKANHHKNE